MVHNISLLTTN